METNYGTKLGQAMKYLNKRNELLQGEASAKDYETVAQLASDLAAGLHAALPEERAIATKLITMTLDSISVVENRMVGQENTDKANSTVGTRLIGVLSQPSTYDVIKSVLNISRQIRDLEKWEQGTKFLPNTLYTLYPTDLHDRMLPLHTYAIMKDLNEESAENELKVCESLVKKLSCDRDKYAFLSPTLAIFVNNIGQTYAISCNAGLPISEIDENYKSHEQEIKTMSSHGYEYFNFKLTQALYYLHALGILHRDLHSRNIMIKCDNDDYDNYNVVLIDFDLSEDGNPTENESEKMECVEAYNKSWFDELVKGGSAKRDGYGCVWGGEGDGIEHFLYRNGRSYAAPLLL